MVSHIATVFACRYPPLDYLEHLWPPANGCPQAELSMEPVVGGEFEVWENSTEAASERCSSI